MRVAKKVVVALARSLAVAGLTTLLILAGFTLLDGLLRGLANYPLDWVREIGDLIAAVCGACCLPVVLLHRGNITLRLFDKLGSPLFVRFLDVAVSAVMSLVMILMACEFFAFGLKTAQAGDVTWLLNVPKAPFWFAVDAALWIAALVQVYVLIEEFAGRAEPREEIAP